MNKRIAIVGIHTGIGKTIAAAVIAEALGADYWKPVQAGLEERDTILVGSLLSNGSERVHPEAVLLSQPLSPHAAAAIDGVTIDHKMFLWPDTDKHLVVETAGGLHSPISAHSTMADMVAFYELPTILVVQNYLGSINHTLLTIDVLRQRGIPLIGIVMNGVENVLSESFIQNYAHVPVICRIPHFQTLDHKSIASYARIVKDQLTKAIWPR